MSIEQLNDFHVVRRILRTVAPDYRLLASSELEPGQSALDVKLKTVEVGETTETMEAVSSLLFQIGHLMMKKDPHFALLFGVGIRSWPKTEPELVKKLVALAVEADQYAYRWSAFVLTSYWPIDEGAARQMAKKHVWSRPEWQEYFVAN